MFAQFSGNEIAINLGLTLLHSLWQGCVIGCVAWVFLSLLKHKGASVRYGVACFALGAMLVAPLLTFGLIHDFSHSQDTSAEVALAIEPQKLSAHKGPESDEAQAALFTPDGQLVSEDVIEEESGLVSSTVLLLERQISRWAPWASVTWLLGVFILLGRLIFGHAYWLRIRHLHAELAPKFNRSRVAALCASMGIDRGVELLLSTQVAVPMVVGWVKPAILMPPALLTGIPSEQLEALLLHELAHIKRFDPLMNFLQGVIETLMFYHPLVWWLSKHIRTERENCCDDIAVSLCDDSAKYAESLLSVLQYVKHQNQYVLSSTGGDVGKRIKRILGMNHDVKKMKRFSWVTIGASLLACWMVALHLVGAQPANAASETVLVFPEMESVGEVFVRSLDDFDAFDITQHYGDKWVTFADAIGDVSIPAGKQVMLVAQSTDLSFLEWQHPDALYALQVKNSEIGDDDLAPVGRLTGLKSLWLRNSTALTDKGLDFFSTLYELETLVLRKVGVEEFPQVTALQELKFLGLEVMPLSDRGVENIASARLPNLRRLEFEKTQVTNAGWVHLQKLPHLVALWLAGIGPDEPALQAIASIPGLEELNLSTASVSDEDFYVLQRANNLRILNLEKTNITDAIVPHLANMPKLEKLNLGGTKITSESLAIFRKSDTLWDVAFDHTGVDIDQAVEFLIEMLPNRSYIPDSKNKQASSNNEALKVGFCFSHYSATGKHWMPKVYGYHNNHIENLVRWLDESNFDVYAIVEPGSEVLGELPLILSEMDLSDKVINILDKPKMLELDVIFKYGGYQGANIRVEEMEALLEYIEMGVGYVSTSGVGMVSPGLGHKLVQQLEGFNKLEYGWWGWNKDMEFEVKNEHPILKGFTKGMPVQVSNFNGSYDPTGQGPINGTVLIGSMEGNEIPFSPMYVRELGKGRIVKCAWLYTDVQSWSGPHKEFYARCVNWAAHEDVDATW